MSGLYLDIDQNACGHCGGCIAVCEPNAIFLDTVHLHERPGKCTACTLCIITCPSRAISLKDAE